MRRDDIQYLADSALVDKFIRLDAVINKRAGMMDNVLTGAADIVKTRIIDKLDNSSPAALGKSVLKLLEPGFFFNKIHPILGVLSAVGQEMGISVTDILSKFYHALSGQLNAGNIPDAGDVQNVSWSMIDQSEADDGKFANDMFHDLRELEKRGQLLTATAGRFDLFRRIGRRRTGNLLVAFIGWFVKTILMSVGLIVGTGAIGNMLGFDTGKGDQAGQGSAMSRQPTQVAPAAPMPQVPAGPAHNLQRSGRGEVFHKNDQSSMWVVPLNGNVQNTLISWAVEIYPELRGHESVIQSVPSFNRMVSILDSYMDYRYPNYLIMPPGFNYRTQVVDSFAGEVANRIQGPEPEQNTRNNEFEFRI